MPITWLNKNRSALALSIFFPWFPLMPVSPPAEPPAVAVEAAAPASEEPMVLPGVVIEEIPKGSALEKAGLQVGDVILSWERLPNPPANPEGAEGELGSYFDWVELEVEQRLRGLVVLRGQRSGEPLELKVEPGRWNAKIQPVLSAALKNIFESGKAQHASGNLEGAVEMWRRLEGNVPADDPQNLRRWILLRIAEVWGEKGEWEKAVQVNREALEASDDSPVQIPIWNALGEALQKGNQFEAAADAYSSTLERSRRIRPRSLRVSLTLSKLGEMAFARDDFNGAHRYFLESLQIQEEVAPEGFNAAACLDYLGAVKWSLGEFDRAQYYLLRAYEIRNNLESDSLLQAYSLNNLGVLAWSRGELDSAHVYHLQALRIREQLVPQSLEMAVSLTNLGEVAWSRGELEHAYDYALRAMSIYRQISPRSAELAHNLNNLGTFAKGRGEFSLARSYYNQALQIREQITPESLGVSSTLTNLGVLAEVRGELYHAREYFSRSLAISEKVAPQSLVSAASLNNLGAVARDLGDLDGAYQFLLRALAIRERLAPRSLALATSLNQLGGVALARGEPNLAYGYHLRALQALEHQVSRLGSSYMVQADFRSRRGVFYRHMMDVLFRQGRPVEAFQVLERFRAQTFLTMLAERDIAFTKDIPDELDRERRQLGVQYDRTLKRLAGLNPREHGEKIEAISQDLNKLDSESGEIEARIRQASPSLAALQHPNPLAASEAQQALDEGTLLVSYSVGNETTKIFALSRSSDLEVKSLPLGEAGLRVHIKQFLGLIAEIRSGPSITSSIGEQRRLQLRHASRELYTTLLGPVADQIASSERLLILPDGPLHALPFGALMRDDGADGQYLAEWKPLHVALSATVFAELKQRRRSADDSGPVQLVAFGDPVYPQGPTKADRSIGDPVVRSAAERGIFDWQPLPYTRREVEGIARLFPEGTARTFLGPEALEERIKSLDPKTRILHLAAHGHTDEHLPSSSFVALTIPDDTKPDDTRDNGLLQVWEIFERVRLDADLVVLSACDTGLGKELGGEGLIGLTRAFQYAGARTVMASLWSIQDQATSELMIRFYKHLRAGLPKDEALRQAQMELIRGPIEVVNEKGEKTLFDASAPYYWAGIQVYGDWQ